MTVSMKRVESMKVALNELHLIESPPSVLFALLQVQWFECSAENEKHEKRFSRQSVQLEKFDGRQNFDDFRLMFKIDPRSPTWKASPFYSTLSRPRRLNERTNGNFVRFSLLKTFYRSNFEAQRRHTDFFVEFRFETKLIDGIFGVSIFF